MPLGNKPFENTVGKGEIALKEQFLLFPQCFLPVWITFFLFGPEQLELYALELGKIAAFYFVNFLASTNINQSAPRLVTMNMSIDLR